MSEFLSINKHIYTSRRVLGLRSTVTTRDTDEYLHVYNRFGPFITSETMTGPDLIGISTIRFRDRPLRVGVKARKSFILLG